MISALVGHLVGDYLAQNDWMALNKKQSSGHCAVHCAVWTACVMLFSGWPFWTWVPLFWSHFLQDRTQIVTWYMDAVGQKSFRTGVCAPWSSIVVDNVWHVVTLWILWKIVGY
jgi:hypothetical protein